MSANTAEGNVGGTSTKTHDGLTAAATDPDIAGAIDLLAWLNAAGRRDALAVLRGLALAVDSRGRIREG